MVQRFLKRITKCFNDRICLNVVVFIVWEEQNDSSTLVLVTGLKEKRTYKYNHK